VATLRLAVPLLLGMIGAAQAAPITETVGAGPGNFASIGAAANAETAGNTYTINLGSGVTYANDFAVFNAPTVVNGNGSMVSTTQPPPNLKGVFTTTNPLTVNNLSFAATPDTGPASLGSGIGAADGYNSSAIREQANGPNTLNLSGVTISNFQMGVLTSSDSGATFADQVSITNSKFYNNGFPTDPADPFAFGHAIYVGDAASLNVSGVLICGQQVGHDIKSRAASTTISNSQLYVGVIGPAGCNVGSASAGIDLPNGGTIDLAGNTITQGTSNQNGALVIVGAENPIYTSTSLVATNNVFTGDGNPKSVGIREFDASGNIACVAPPTGSGNVFSGVGAYVMPSRCGSLTGGTLVAVPEPGTLPLLATLLLIVGMLLPALHHKRTVP
jgi:hypothetical protein